jgi:hypothetical protein
VGSGGQFSGISLFFCFASVLVAEGADWGGLSVFLESELWRGVVALLLVAVLLFWALLSLLLPVFVWLIYKTLRRIVRELERLS